MQKPNRPRWPLIGIGAGVCFLLVDMIASFIPQVVERVYSRGIYLRIVNTLSAFSSQMPFSLTDISHLMIVPLLIAVFFWGRRRSLIHAVWITAGVAGFLYAYFILAWGLNYKRPPLAVLLEIPETLASEKKAGLLKRIVAETNQFRTTAGKSVDSEGCFTIDRDLLSLDRNVAESEETFLSKKRFPLPVSTPIKTRPLSAVLLSFGNSGIYGPLTGEANITFPCPPGMLAFTLAHERAHRAGFASETDASVVAFLSLRASENPELRYAGYLAFWDHVAPKEVERMGLSAPVQNDLKCIREFWKKYPDYGQRKLWRVYDWFLKLQGQKRGVQSYSDATEVALRYWSQ